MKSIRALFTELVVILEESGPEKVAACKFKLNYLLLWRRKAEGRYELPYSELFSLVICRLAGFNGEERDYFCLP